jgi:hypothetical protein
MDESFELIIAISLHNIINYITEIETISQEINQELAQIAIWEINTDYDYSEQRTEREQHKAVLNRELTILTVWIILMPLIITVSKVYLR